MIKVQTEVLNKDLSIDPKAVEKLVSAVLFEHGIQEGEVTVIFGTDKMLHNLKLTFFNEDEYTDVIAFRLDESLKETFEGEIYISLERASENAEFYGVSLANELIRLICHGSLHLVGHKDDAIANKAAMRQLEDKFLSSVSEQDFIRLVHSSSS